MMEEPGVPTEKHQSWMSNYYNATCQCQESNLGSSGDKQEANFCSIQALTLYLTLRYCNFLKYSGILIGVDKSGYQVNSFLIS